METNGNMVKREKIHKLCEDILSSAIYSWGEGGDLFSLHLFHFLLGFSFRAALLQAQPGAARQPPQLFQKRQTILFS
jgi:hypothetical protein